MEHRNWKCVKCSSTTFETDTIAATGTGFSKLFDIQNRHLTLVTCEKCKYTEIYKVDPSDLSNILDILVGG